MMKSKKKNGMRKKLAVFCMFCMLLMTCIGSLTVYAQSDTKLTVSAGNAEQGKTTEVTFNLEGNPGIWGLKFRVGYDHSALKLTSVTNGNVFSDGDVTLPETLDKEQFVYLASANKLENISTNGTMVTLSFQVAESAELKSYPITLEITQAINVDGEDIAVDAKEGSVTVITVEPENTPEPTTENTSEPTTDNTPVLPQDNPPVEESKPASAPVNEQVNNEAVQTKKPEVKKRSKAPNTSDSNSIAVWGVVTLGCSAAIALVVYNRRRNSTKA